MSETIIESEGTTAAESDGNYSKPATNQKVAGIEQTIPASEESGGDYVVVYGGKKKSIFVSYNSVDAKSKAFRKELNKLLQS